MSDTLRSSIVTDHSFEPKGEWFSLCKHCNLSEAAHLSTATSKPCPQCGFKEEACDAND